MIIDKEYKCRAGSWTGEFSPVELEMPVDAVIVDIHWVGSTVSLWAQEPYPVPDSGKEVQRAKREFHLYRVGRPYRKPLEAEFKFHAIVGEADFKYAVYERIAKY